MPYFMFALHVIFEWLMTIGNIEFDCDDVVYVVYRGECNPTKIYNAAITNQPMSSTRLIFGKLLWGFFSFHFVSACLRWIV